MEDILKSTHHTSSVKDKARIFKYILCYTVWHRLHILYSKSHYVIHSQVSDKRQTNNMSMTGLKQSTCHTKNNLQLWKLFWRDGFWKEKMASLKTRKPDYLIFRLAKNKIDLYELEVHETHIYFRSTSCIYIGVDPGILAEFAWPLTGERLSSWLHAIGGTVLEKMKI